MSRTLRDLGEVEAIRGFVDVFEGCEELVVGPGEDDCAVLEVGGVTLVQSSDLFLEGVHFLGDAEPYRIGHHAAAASASDVASMGARVLSATLSLAVPGDRGAGVLRGLAEGANAAMRGAGGCVVGGDLTDGELALDVGVVGMAEGDVLLRSGAEEGDVVGVTGPLGGAAAGELVMKRELSIPSGEEAVRRLYEVPVRAEEGLRLSGVASACTDLSDGLGRGLSFLSEASGVGLEVDLERVELHRCAAEAVKAGVEREWLVNRGGDYELLFTAPPEAAEGLGFRVIGEVGGGGVRLNGEPAGDGYDAYS